MSFFDSLKDKASELLQSATDKVTEATGVDLGGVTDQATESAEGLTNQAEGLTDQAQDHANTAGDQLADATGIEVPTEGLTDTATDKLNDLTGR
ncbi:hypothetical protein [Kribbella ginsengisoli]|uniref:Antitoxin n=1 Tax=Kribbella ginsengisoli TaxID=363865 RepID=A0ABP6WFU3_9ACTN